MGRVSVRVGWNVPRNAVAIARATADDPSVAQTGETVSLRTPSDARTRRAVTITYEVHVPTGTAVVTKSESGETRIGRVRGAVSLRTQSGAVKLVDLGETRIETGSGAVSVDGAGPLSVTTLSSAITVTRLVSSRLGSARADRVRSGDRCICRRGRCLRRDRVERDHRRRGQRGTRRLDTERPRASLR